MPFYAQVPVVTTTCVELLTLPHATAPDISPIGIDAGYPPNHHCDWTVACERGHPHITFVDVSTEEGFDHIYVYDVSELSRTEIVKAHGADSQRGLPDPHESSGSALHVNFIADGDVEHVGFLAHVGCTTNYKFSGCVESECETISALPSGYIAEHPEATTVSGFGRVECDSAFSGVAVATCPSEGGSFSFSGCDAKRCQAGSGKKNGYTVCAQDDAIDALLTSYTSKLAEELSGVDLGMKCDNLLTDPCGLCHNACGSPCECRSHTGCPGSQFCSPMRIGETSPQNGSEAAWVFAQTLSDDDSSPVGGVTTTVKLEGKWDFCGECLTCTPGCDCTHDVCNRYDMTAGDICEEANACDLCKESCFDDALCEDDSAGLFSSFGFACANFLQVAADCTVDLDLLWPGLVPPGLSSQLSDLCPVMCDTCPPANTAVDATCIAVCDSSDACTLDTKVVSRCMQISEMGSDGERHMVCARTTPGDVSSPPITGTGVSDVPCNPDSLRQTAVAQCHEQCEAATVCTDAATAPSWHGTKLAAMMASAGCKFQPADVLISATPLVFNSDLWSMCPKECGACDPDGTTIAKLSGNVFCEEHYEPSTSALGGSVNCAPTDLEITGACRKSPHDSSSRDDDSSPSTPSNLPGFGVTGGYAGDLYCEWTVVCTLGQVQVSFAEFDTEATHDYLLLYDAGSDASPMATLMGSDLDQPGATNTWTSLGSTMSAVFSSDSLLHGTGFHANVVCVGAESLLDIEGNYEGCTDNPCVSDASSSGSDAYTASDQHVFGRYCCDDSEISQCENWCCGGLYLCSMEWAPTAWYDASADAYVQPRVNCPSWNVSAITCDAGATAAAAAQVCEMRYSKECTAADHFSFSGCVSVTCIVGSGDRTGYDIPDPSAADVPEMGRPTCRDNYHPTVGFTPRRFVNCPRSGADFVFSGCTENSCSHIGEDTNGVTLPDGDPSVSTVSGIRTLAIAAGSDKCGCPSSYGWEVDVDGNGACSSDGTTTADEATVCIDLAELNGVYSLYLECDWKYSGIGSISCKSDSGTFDYSGCTEVISVWLLFVLPICLCVFCVLPALYIAREKHKHAGKSIQIEQIERFTTEEMEAAFREVDKHITKNEKLVWHFTSHPSAEFITARGSHGLRASKVGQLGGGLSVCTEAPHDLGWNKYGKGPWRENVGRALWGERWQNVLEGGPDEDKLGVVFFLKVPEEFVNNKDRIVPGRPAVYIIQNSLLREVEDNHYLGTDHIVKAFGLMPAPDPMEGPGTLGIGQVLGVGGALLSTIKTATVGGGAEEEGEEGKGEEGKGPGLVNFLEAKLSGSLDLDGDGDVGEVEGRGAKKPAEGEPPLRPPRSGTPPLRRIEVSPAELVSA